MLTLELSARDHGARGFSGVNNIVVAHQVLPRLTRKLVFGWAFTG